MEVIVGCVSMTIFARVTIGDTQMRRSTPDHCNETLAILVMLYGPQTVTCSYVCLSTIRLFAACG